MPPLLPDITAFRLFCHYRLTLFFFSPCHPMLLFRRLMFSTTFATNPRAARAPRTAEYLR